MVALVLSSACGTVVAVGDDDDVETLGSDVLGFGGPLASGAFADVDGRGGSETRVVEVDGRGASETLGVEDEEAEAPPVLSAACAGSARPAQLIVVAMVSARARRDMDMRLFSLMGIRVFTSRLPEQRRRQY